MDTTNYPEPPRELGFDQTDLPSEQANAVPTSVPTDAERAAQELASQQANAESNRKP